MLSATDLRRLGAYSMPDGSMGKTSETSDRVIEELNKGPKKGLRNVKVGRLRKPLKTGPENSDDPNERIAYKLAGGFGPEPDLYGEPEMTLESYNMSVMNEFLSERKHSIHYMLRTMKWRCGIR